MKNGQEINDFLVEQFKYELSSYFTCHVEDKEWHKGRARVFEECLIFAGWAKESMKNLVEEIRKSALNPA